jgi:hypothetical protein
MGNIDQKIKSEKANELADKPHKNIQNKELRTILKETIYVQITTQNSTTEKHVGRAVPNKRPWRQYGPGQSGMKLPHQLGIHQTLNKPTLVTRWTRSERYEAPPSSGHTSNPEHTNTTRERNCNLM